MSTKRYELRRSTRTDKKWMVLTPSGKTVHFGAKGYEDYTMHKDEGRMRNYVSRHRARENWAKSGMDTPGFWSRWLLWNKPSFEGSRKDIERRFNVKVVKR